MPRAPFRPFSTRYVVLRDENIDTDQIIPARFLTTTSRHGLGSLAFHDWRYHADGTVNRDFALGAPGASDAHILVAGRNFGCGSSREHAVWALQGAGFDAVISTQFADIFRGNALGNGLLPIEVSAGVLETLMSDAPVSRAAIDVDLTTRSLRLSDGETVSFPIDAFARHCLLEGIGELDFLLGAASEIDAYERANS